METEKDPVEAGEWAAIIIGIAVFTLDLIILAFAFYHRNYLPLKIKQLPVVACSLFAGMFWFVGGMSSLRVLPQAGYPVFLECSVWGIWSQLVLGAFLWCCLEVYRFWRLFFIVKLVKSPSSWLFRISFFLFWTPALLFGILATALKANAVQLFEGKTQCKMHSLATYAAIFLSSIYYLIFIFFFVSLRNIKQKYVHEYQETRMVALGFCVLFVIYSILVVLRAHDHVWGRALCSMMILGIINFGFIGHICVPLYHILRDKAEYLEEFEKERRTVGKSNFSSRPPPEAHE